MKIRAAAAAAKKAHPLARAQAWLRVAVLENWHLKLLSLAVAFALFAVSRQPRHELMLANVSLDYVNLAPGLEISGKALTAVNVRLQGPRDVVQGVMASQLEVKADLSHKTAGERVIQLKAADVIKPEKVEVQRIEPQSIELKLETTRRKTVPIEPQFVGYMAEGFERTSVTLEPATIEIEGPESRIEQVGKILTESIHLEDRRASFQLQVDLETNKQGVRLTTVKPIILKIAINPKKNIE